jgi:beta-mannosidase
VRRRSHHACLLLWCGGNELQDAPPQPGAPTRPQDETHPALAALQKVVAREDPGTRFLPASPSGPVFYAQRADMGKGIHHHVHGPWDTGGQSEAEWLDYWSHDDSLLRSEAGVTGTAEAREMERYVGGKESVWPPGTENPSWRHSSAWWLNWRDFEGLVGGMSEREALARVVEISQARQARFLEIAARACKDRFPRCAGFLVWMGHDAFPCPANTSFIDFDRQPKAAYDALRAVFRG